MSDTLDLPCVDLSSLLELAPGAEITPALSAAAAIAADALHRYGLLLVRDPRASEVANDAFIDLLESYFEQPEEVKLADVRADVYYQVGATPSRVELPRNHCSRMNAFAAADKPLSLCPPEKDPKWRFFWRVGAPPAETAFPQLNAPPVVPAGIPGWSAQMDAWGAVLLGAAAGVAELAAIGFGLERDAFSRRMAGGPHLLAPTASDFSRFDKVGTVLAGFHYDLNFLTAHGRSRYPGLYVWTRDGRRLAVKVPKGALLVQAGAQFQYLTGGHVLAGFHEVVVTEATAEAIRVARNDKKSLWRISSTLFSHIASDVTLTPIGRFATPDALAAFPPMKTGDHVAAELAAINLGEGSDGAAAAAQ
jgi:isopenicillin N synthase-like dioxygenase